MRHALFLALAWLRAAPWRALAVVVALAVAMVLPLFTARLGPIAEARLLERARSSPILVGRPGDQLDLVMASLYFRGEVRTPLSQADVLRVQALEPGLVVPLHLGFRAGGAPVVGTTLDYFTARDLRLAEGRRPAVLGEVVAGSEVARAAHLAPGDTLRTEARELYNLAGSYPILLRVVGVLAPTGGPDDEALFVDLKTTWVIEGLLHGHAALGARDVVGGTEEELEASLSMFLFTEIDPSTLPSFHLHGGPADWPVSAVLVFPQDARAHDQALGDLTVMEGLQPVRPTEVVRGILGIVLRLQALLGAWVVLVTLSTLGLVSLVVSLVLRLRSAEVALLRRIGAAPGRIAATLALEAGLLVAVAGALAVAGAWSAEVLLLAWLGW